MTTTLRGGRRRLRADIEKQGRNISEDFLAAAETVTAVHIRPYTLDTLRIRP